MERDDGKQASSEDMLREVESWLDAEKEEPTPGPQETGPPGGGDTSPAGEEPASPFPMGGPSSPADDPFAPTTPVPRAPIPPSGPTGFGQEAPRPRVGRAFLFGGIAAIAGALVWGLVGGYLEFQSWLIAIGVGAVIGRVVAYGAVTVDRAVQVIVVPLTLGAVLVGEVLGLAFALNRDAGFFDLPFAFELYFKSIPDMGSQFWFAVGGGLIGAFLGAQVAGSQRGRPKGSARSWS